MGASLAQWEEKSTTGCPDKVSEGREFDPHTRHLCFLTAKQMECP